MADVHAIRAAAVALVVPAGFQGIDHVPEDVQQMPAAVAGVPTEIDYGASLGLARITFPLTLIFSAASLKDAQLKMDQALSTTDGSAVTLLRAAVDTPTDDWRSIHVVRADNIRLADAGNSKALAVDVTLEVLARK